MHLTFGINLLLAILDENPELQTEEFADEIRALILQAVELEKPTTRHTCYQCLGSLMPTTLTSMLCT